MRRVLVIAILTLFSTTTFGQESKWAHHSGDITFIVGYEKGREIARASGKPMMLFFTTTWCGWCKKLAGESFVQPDVVAELAGFVPVIVDGDTEKEVCKEYGVQGYPDIKFVTLDGKRHAEVHGYVKTKEFSSRIAEAKKSIGPVKYTPEYRAHLSKSLKALSKKRKYRDALLVIFELEQGGATEKQLEKARAVRKAIEKKADSLLAKAKKAQDKNPADSKKLLEAIRKEFIGLKAAAEADKLLGPTAKSAH